MNNPESPPAPAKASKEKKPPRAARRVEYKVKLSTTEDKQLVAVRDSCRSAGIRVSKAKLLRAAVVLLNQHSSFKIEEQLHELAPLKSERKKKDK